MNPSHRRLLNGRPLTLLARGLLIVSVAALTSRQHSALRAAQNEVDANVVYGTQAGVPLFMDVHRPQKANGYGVVLVPGNGWAGLSEPGGKPLKDYNPQVPLFMPPLVAAGYTVFVVEHRGAPRFHYPSQIEDVARAVRFVRHEATRYGINGARIGAVGYSSGANLVAMLGVRPDINHSTAADPVDRESARIQCVVGGGTPAYLGVDVGEYGARSAGAEALLREASPINYVTPDDSPMLLFNGATDLLVPASNSRSMAAALRKAGVSAQVIELSGTGHWPLNAAEVPHLLTEMIAWLDRCLAGTLQAPVKSPPRLK